jgi:putative transposase
MTKETIASIPIKRPKPTKKKPQGMCLDKGYDFDEVRDVLREFDIPLTSGRAGKKPRTSNEKPGRKQGGG